MADDEEYSGGKTSGERAQPRASRPCQVRFVLPKFFPSIGGVETRVKEIAARLAVKGIDVEVCSFDLKSTTREIGNVSGIEVRRFRAFAPRDAYYFPELGFFEWVRHHPAEIVDAQNIHALPAIAAAVCGSRGKLFLTPHYHGEGHTFLRRMFFKMYRQNLVRKMIQKCQNVICVSPEEKALFERDFAECNDKLVLIPNGIDLPELSKCRWKPTVGRHTVLYVGRLEEYKNVGVLIRATAVLKRRLGRDLRLVIIGSGPHKNSLQRYSVSMGLQHSIDWIGEVTRESLLRYYQTSTAFVMPSMHEAYSLATAEAIAIGVPTVVSNVGPLATYARDGLASGVDSTNAAQLAECLFEITRNPARYSYQADLSKHFRTWDRVAADVERLYASS
jgi:glycosyltransferase involved in cell wall biosynthesis